MIYYPEKREKVLDTGRKRAKSFGRNLAVFLLVFLTAGTLFFIYQSGGFTDYSFATVRVEGLYCEACPPRIKKAIEEVPGVIKAEVELSSSRAIVYFDPSKTVPEQFIKAIDNAGTGGYKGEVLVIKKGGKG